MIERVEHILSSGGPIARALGGGYESRPEQGQMARAVAAAMEARSHLLVEAGTGVGKSYAYLVPAILRCVLRGERVVIATNTIALQEQLVEKDIPLLRAVLEEAGVVPRGSETAGGESDGATRPRSEGGGEKRHALRPVLVKGRGNYVSIRRLKLASSRQEKLLADAASRRTLHAIEDWAYETTDGTLATLPQLERPAVWDRVQSDSGNCMGRRCPHNEACFYQRARREMEAGNLLITNHALFFSDLALRARDAGFLPEYDHVVLDEAHNVEDVAAEHFGLSLTEGRVIHLLGLLSHARTGRGYLAQLGVVVGDTDKVDGAVRLVIEAENACRAFFDDLARAARAESGAGKRVRSAGVVENGLTPAMRALSLKLKSLREEVKNEADRFELNAYALRAEEIAETAAALVEQKLDGCAYWIEADGAEESGAGRGGSGAVRPPRIALACSPVEVGPLLKEHLFGQKHSVVLTSATLATRQVKRGEHAERAETAFAHAMERLGCEGAGTLQLGSPFDHAAQVELYIDTSMPRPAGGGGGGAYGRGPDRYTQELARRIVEQVAATEGGAFVLFTSFGTLNAVAEQLRAPLARLGLPLLVQGKDGPRSEILRRFREDERSVLLGAASFWQGVDVRGRGLRNVIITRLPFDPPDRPLTEARMEAIRDRGGDPFREDSLPRAVIRFKQGFGRLIRSKSDTGRVVVLDPRIVTASYGKRFLEALPEGVRVVAWRSGGAVEGAA